MIKTKQQLRCDELMAEHEKDLIHGEYQFAYTRILAAAQKKTVLLRPTSKPFSFYIQRHFINSNANQDCFVDEPFFKIYCTEIHFVMRTQGRTYPVVMFCGEKMYETFCPLRLKGKSLNTLASLLMSEPNHEL